MSYPRRWSVPVLALLLFATLLPVASADHVYSHRYLVQGRVVDAAGRPVGNLQVNLSLVGFTADLGVCQIDVQHGINPGRQVSEDKTTATESFTTTTEATGTFYFCTHIDAPIPRAATVQVETAGVSKETKADQDIRASFFPIQLRDTSHHIDPAGAERFNKTYLVSGIVWQPTDRQGLENILVNGLAIRDVALTLTLAYNDGKTATAHATSSNYGHFLAVLNLTEPLRSGTVTVSGANATVSTPADPLFHVSNVVVKEQRAPSGSDALLIATGGVLVVAGVGAGGWYAWRRIADKRELEIARTTTTRRRSKR